VWFESSTRAGDQARSRAVADSYIDLVFGRDLWVRGPDTHAHSIRYGAGSRFVGIRFRPGAAGAVLGVPASDLVDRRVFLRELWGGAADELAERLSGMPEGAIADTLQAVVLERLRPRDPVSESVVALLTGEVRASTRTLAERVGLSERQLLRRSRLAFGYGPKTLQRILRLQRFLGLAATGRVGLSRLAFASGYADQAHLTRECRRLTGEAPTAFVP
jgi:AraC-like DNA-binding protein